MSVAKKPASSVSPSVVRSLYRSLVRQARKLDDTPMTKTLLPIPQQIADIMNFRTKLYPPGSVRYVDVVRDVFRSGQPQANVKLGFDTLGALHRHNEAVQECATDMSKDRAPLMASLSETPVDAERFHAAPIQFPLVAPAPQLPPPSTPEASSAVLSKLRKASSGFDVKPGTGLIAHPLSSAHMDRRVILVTEKNPLMTTGLVLDMVYSYPLSHGNPMFPEVLWGHEVYNGGYCHVDLTMPPTASVTVLHTIDAPKPQTTSYSRWMQWATQQGEGTDEESLQRQHAAFCTPLISEERSDGTRSTLYVSKSEALHYLGSICPGLPRTALRVYWGCMKWPTAQLANEVSKGHWMPMKISPEFFGAYPLTTPGSNMPLGDVTNRFPTEEEIREKKEQRTKHLGADVVAPQQFPPSQPVCRREALWDQIMYAADGEYRSLVGCTNPFANPQQNLQRVPPVGVTENDAANVIAALAAGEDIDEVLMNLEEHRDRGGDDDDDDDGEDGDGEAGR